MRHEGACGEGEGEGEGEGGGGGGGGGGGAPERAPSREVLMAMSVRELKAVMAAMELDAAGCLEKGEFADAILEAAAAAIAASQLSARGLGCCAR